MLPLLLTLACAPAWHPTRVASVAPEGREATFRGRSEASAESSGEGAGGRVPPPPETTTHVGRLDLAVPAGWTITKNRRWLGNDLLALSDPQARASITVALVRGDPASAQLPLDLLAETRALSAGRALGIESAGVRMHQVVLDGHEAWAVTGQRRWHFARSDFSTLVARVGGHVAIVTLEAPAGHLGSVAAPWAVVLDSLRFPLDPVPDDAPLFDPHEDGW